MEVIRFVVEIGDGVSAFFLPCPFRVCEVVPDLGVSCTPVALVWIIHNHSLPVFPAVACFCVLFCGTATLHSGPVGMSFRKAGVETRFATGNKAWHEASLERFNQSPNLV